MQTNRTQAYLACTSDTWLRLRSPYIVICCGGSSTIPPSSRLRAGEIESGTNHRSLIKSVKSSQQTNKSRIPLH